MARSKLYIICGNCGSNEALSYCLEDDGSVLIGCSNCGRLHALDDYVEREVEEDD